MHILKFSTLMIQDFLPNYYIKNLLLIFKKRYFRSKKMSCSKFLRKHSIDYH